MTKNNDALEWVNAQIKFLEQGGQDSQQQFVIDEMLPIANTIKSALQYNDDLINYIAEILEFASHEKSVPVSLIRKGRNFIANRVKENIK